jgi:alpha-glucosidase (family GH31 glycosyl hydrolase)
MDKVLDIGVDGWKCDGTDPYINEYVGAHGFQG